MGRPLTRHINRLHSAEHGTGLDRLKRQVSRQRKGRIVGVWSSVS